MTWKAFWKTAIWTACGASIFIYATILAVDPYDSIWFSPPLNRVPIAENQRFSYPAVARKSEFDSILIGTSTTRMIRPVLLNQALGGKFANLSMNSGTAYEQNQLFKVFARHHPRPRSVIVGIDTVWCEVGDSYEKFTPRPFPAWLYDVNSWNDLLHVFNLPTIEQAGRLAAYFMGLRDARYGRDGYRNFLPPRSQYDAAAVRFKLYGKTGPRFREAMVPPQKIDAAERKSWRFATHPLLVEVLSSLPAATHKVMVFVPYHHFRQAAEGSREAARWRECKRRVVEIARDFENSHVLDFMIRSDITLNDENYWDPLHYGVETASSIVELIAHGVGARCGVTGSMDYLIPAEDGGGDFQICAGPKDSGL